MNSIIKGLQFVLVVAFVSGLIFRCLIEIKRHQCEARWQETYSAKYEVGSGCRIMVNGHWIPAANYFEIAH